MTTSTSDADRLAARVAASDLAAVALAADLDALDARFAAGDMGDDDDMGQFDDGDPEDMFDSEPIAGDGSGRDDEISAFVDFLSF